MSAFGGIADINSWQPGVRFWTQSGHRSSGGLWRYQLETTRVDARIDLLVNRLAVAQLSSIFERAYGAIYGSQIAALRALSKAGGAVTNIQALEYFNEAKSTKPELSNVEFSVWLEFLRVFNLVKIENEKILITDLGSDFLLYLTAQNLNETKPG